MKIIHQVKAVLAGIVLSSSVVPVATAEDIEIYNSLGASSASSNPNIMFIVDTSGSMSATSLVKESYVDSGSYTGSCASDGIYFVSDGKPPNCATSTDYFDRAALVCDHALTAWSYDGTRDPSKPGSLGLIGTYSDQLAQFDPVKKKWRELTIGTSSERSYMVECFSDSGFHGASTGGGKYIEDGGSGYTSTSPTDPKIPHLVWAGGEGNLQLFDGNYLNYLNDSSVPMVWRSYIDQVKSAVEIMVRGNTRVDIGLMQFDERYWIDGQRDTEGGPVRYPILDVGADRSDFFSRLSNLPAISYTPLSEVYYEALLYFGGKNTNYGRLSTPKNSTGSTVGGNAAGSYFVSPITGTCDKNYIVLLSDGQPTADDLDAAQKNVLTGFDANSCMIEAKDINVTDDNQDAFNSDGSSKDNCLDELSGWAFTKDVAEDPSIPAHDGVQHITTHTIGFQLGNPGGIQLMRDAATKGGGGFHEAKTEAELIEIFNLIIASTLQVNSTFSSPAVSVNAFNRSTHLDDLYFTLFKPGEGNHWDGNLKKYKLEFEEVAGERVPFIADATSTADTPVHAVDTATGFFSESSKSYWTTGAADGKEVTLGGAASVLTNNRNVYTNTSAYNSTAGVDVPQTPALTSGANEVADSNTDLTDALLGITGFPEFIAGTPYRETLLEWAAGRDALSQFGTANTYTDARTQMGDPLHAQPALVQYGGTAAAPDLVAYVATNDGYLHAINVDDGTELYSFIPQELLPNLVTAMEDTGGQKLYGLDGSVVAWIDDADNNGTISGSDRVILYVSMRRGGRNIYALDVTIRTSPELLWVIKGGTGEYTELGDTWSAVNVEKIKNGSLEKTVLVFGGGYDKTQDSATVRTTDSVGRAVYIADALTGERLWIGSDGGDTNIGTMEYSIPGRVKPLDISGDGFIDRLYAVDVGGQVFRFDIDNTNGALLSASVSGGRIADLADTGVENARRFYYPPDVALIAAKDGKYHALALSSGFRAHPLDTAVHDRIYMLKDRKTGLIKTGYTTLLESDLHDASDNIAGGDGADDATRDAEIANVQGAEGWYIDLEDENNPGTWLGEKGLAEPLILEGQVILSTYTPNMFSAANVCEPNIGLGKVFFMDIQDATPTYPAGIDKRPQRHVELARGGIPPSPNVIITPGGEPTLCIGTECGSADFDLGVHKTYWYEVEK